MQLLFFAGFKLYYATLKNIMGYRINNNCGIIYICRTNGGIKTLLNIVIPEAINLTIYQDAEK
jgi:hypothetical protein